jgi:hypothetical protein
MRQPKGEIVFYISQGGSLRGEVKDVTNYRLLPMYDSCGSNRVTIFSGKDLLSSQPVFKTELLRNCKKFMATYGDRL